MSIIQCSVPPSSILVHRTQTTAAVGKAHEVNDGPADVVWPGWWFNPDAGDFGWPDVVAESDLAPPSPYPAMPALPGSSLWVAPASMNGAQVPVNESNVDRAWVYRFTFDLPAGAVTAAILAFVGYENVFNLAINGLFVSPGAINPVLFRPNARNLLSVIIGLQPYFIGVFVPSTPTCLAFTLDVTQVVMVPPHIRATVSTGKTLRLTHHA